MDSFSKTFSAAIPNLRKEILRAFRIAQSTAGFRSVWEHFEQITNPVLIAFLTTGPLQIRRADITETISKSTYPDLKVIFQSKLYAIDVKSGESKRDPWYDIGRLDTYEEKHLKKYAGEFSVVVKWQGRNPTEVTDVYVEPTFQTVGFRKESKGVLYRPYDGKLRPKPWSYFAKGESYWQNREHFQRGLEASRNYRRMSQTLGWFEVMNSVQRTELLRKLNALNEGNAVDFDRGIQTPEENESDS